jgi:hypothetical protein
MTQLTLDLGLLPESVIIPPIPLPAELKRALVTQMAAAIIAVYQAGGSLTALILDSRVVECEDGIY